MTTDSSSRSRPISDAGDGRDAALGRRAFLGATLSTFACLALGCTVPPRSFRAPAATASGEVRVPIARYPELERRGGLVKVLTSDDDVVYVRRGEGEAEAFEALSAICTHQGCTIAPEGDGFRCPCHGSTYDREGRNTGGPAPRPLARYTARRVGDDVVIALGGPR
jgi:Rieske Fe-S protein